MVVASAVESAQDAAECAGRGAADAAGASEYRGVLASVAERAGNRNGERVRLFQSFISSVFQVLRRPNNKQICLQKQGKGSEKLLKMQEAVAGCQEPVASGDIHYKRRHGFELESIMHINTGHRKLATGYVSQTKFLLFTFDF